MEKQQQNKFKELLEKALIWVIVAVGIAGVAWSIYSISGMISGTS